MGRVVKLVASYFPVRGKSLLVGVQARLQPFPYREIYRNVHKCIYIYARRRSYPPLSPTSKNWGGNDWTRENFSGRDQLLPNQTMGEMSFLFFERSVVQSYMFRACCCLNAWMVPIICRRCRKKKWRKGSKRRKWRPKRRWPSIWKRPVLEPDFPPSASHFRPWVFAIAAHNRERRNHLMTRTGWGR